MLPKHLRGSVEPTAATGDSEPYAAYRDRYRPESCPPRRALR